MRGASSWKWKQFYFQEEVVINDKTVTIQNILFENNGKWARI